MINKMEEFQIPRIMIAAPSSGSGKTMITCGLLKAFQNRMWKTIAYKCGPDYIDPMFHRKVTEIPCRNLDSYFSTQNQIEEILYQSGKEMDLAVLEGVMGYFDGIAGTTVKASSYELADLTKTPVILIADVKGMSVSVIPYLKGFLDYEKRKHIKGVILNRVSPMFYKRMKEMIEKELPIQVIGYCSEQKEAFAGSRYLGLQMPEEIENLQNKINELALQLEGTVDMDALLSIAREAAPLKVEKQKIEPFKEEIRIAIARDEAFCFYYEDNLDLLKKYHVTLIPFSPLKDAKLPERIKGVILGGGYPELYAKALSSNQTMRKDILKNLQNGLPYLAECGGYLYLQERLQAQDSIEYPMIGFFKGKGYKTERLQRFGYIELTPTREDSFLNGETIKGHEFHYYDVTDPGQDYLAKKPESEKQWQCMHVSKQGAAGFPHLYYRSNIHFIENFLKICMQYKV